MTKSRQLKCRLLFPVLVALAVLPDAIASGQLINSEKEMDQATRELLEHSISVEFIDTRFDEVLKYWTESLGVRFLLDNSAVDNNLEHDTLITLQLGEVRGASVMSFILGNYDCTWQIRDGIVHIVSDDYAYENPSLETFDCVSILAAIHPVKRKRIVPNVGHVASGERRSDPVLRSGGVFSVVTQDPPRQQPAADSGPGTTQQTPAEATTPQLPSSVVVIDEVISPESQLIELIETVVDPDSWESNGGTGRIVALNGKLFVVTTCENQRHVKALLEELR